MDLTIVIVNWNGGELLLRCLRSIRACRRPSTLTVLVVDNNSSDGSREEAAREFPEFEVLNSGGNIGFGRANNLVRPRVTTPLVLFLNPDTELREDTLEQAIGCIQKHGDVGALGCKMRYPDGEVQEQGLQWFPSPGTVFLELLLTTRTSRKRLARFLPTLDPLKSGPVRKLYGGFVLARKEVLDAAGWFDDRYFMYAEDVDLSITILRLGWKLYYCSEAEIMHVAGGTSAKAPSGFAILMKSESVNRLMTKYHGPFGGYMHRVAVGAGAVLRSVVLAMMWFGALVGGSAQRHALENSLFKHRLMVLWALGLRKAVVAGSRAGSC